MKTKMMIIRITLWWGIIADVLEAVRMILPQVFIKTMGMNAINNDGLRFSLLYGAPVMMGWSGLLFWASIKPIERRGIFLCLILVILGYVIIEIIGISMGILDFIKIMPTFILQISLISLVIVSYIITVHISIKDKK